MTGSVPPARGGRRWRDWYVALVAAGAAAFCLGPSLVGDRTLISVNSLTNFLPWAAAGNEAAGHQLCQSDTVDSVMPSISYVRSQVFSGHLASWQSLQAGGGPLASLPNTGLLDPLSLPYWILPLRWAPAFVILLTWLASIGGTFLFLRRLRVGRPGATLGGFVFATSGFMVMWSNWPQARTAALIPFLFWATDRAATRSGPLDAVLLAVAVASMLFGGFPEITGFALYMAGAYFVVRVAFRYRRAWRPAAQAATAGIGGLVLGVALAAVQMLPFLDFYRTDNFAYRTGLSTVGLPLSGLVTVVAPNTNGLCIVGKPVYGLVDPVELVAYIGAAALVLAVLGAAFGLRSRRSAQAGVRGFLLGAVVVAVVLCWVSPSARHAVASFPVFSGNFIGRIRCVVAFALAALAGLGFDWLTSSRAPADAEGLKPMDLTRPGHLLERGRHMPGWSRALWPGFVCAEALLFGFAVLLAGHRDASQGHYLKAWQDAVRTPLILVLATVLLAGAVITVSRWGRPDTGQTARGVAFVLLPVLVAVQGGQFFHSVMPGDDPKAFYPATGDHDFLAANLGSERFGSAGLSLYAATAFYYGLRSVTGHQFNDPRWNTLLTAVDPHVMMTPTNSNFSGDINSGDISHQPLLDLMAVRYFVLPPTDVAGAAERLAGPTGTVTSASGPLSCPVDGGPLRGVQVRLGAPLQPAAPLGGVTIGLHLTGPGVDLDSGVYLTGRLPAGTLVTIPVAGEGLPAGRPLQALLSVQGSAAPAVLTASGGAAQCAAVRPIPDQLKLVYASPGALIYQRTTALSRIRWVPSADVVPDPAAQLKALAAGQGATTVLLSAPGPTASGASGQVTVGADYGDRITATVQAAGSGYLLVADPMQLPGWSVRVDGAPAPLRAADYAMVAVWVPAGTHTITFTYTAPGQVVGAAVSAGAVVVALSLLWWERPRRARPAHAAGRNRVI